MRTFGGWLNERNKNCSRCVGINKIIICVYVNKKNELKFLKKQKEKRERSGFLRRMHFFMKKLTRRTRKQKEKGVKNEGKKKLKTKVRKRRRKKSMKMAY